MSSDDSSPDAEGTHVLVAPEMVKQAKLTQTSLGQDLFGEHVGHFLDGAGLAGLSVASGCNTSAGERMYHKIDSPVGALTELLHELPWLLKDTAESARVPMQSSVC